MGDEETRFIQEAMNVASTLLSWREGPKGDKDLVWEHNDREIWGRVERLIEHGNVAFAAAMRSGAPPRRSYGDQHSVVLKVLRANLEAPDNVRWSLAEKIVAFLAGAPPEEGS